MSTYSVGILHEASSTTNSSPLSEEITSSVTEADWSSEEPAWTPATESEQSPELPPDLPPAKMIKDCYNVQWLIDEDAVIVTVDLEAHCHNQSFKDFQAGVRNQDRMVCEIGLAIVDSRELRDVQPGDRYQMSGIRSRHTTSSLLVRNIDLPKVPLAAAAATVKFVPKEEVKDSFVKTVRSFVREGSTSKKNGIYTNGRKVVWMFFAMHHDVRWLDEMGIDLRGEFPNSDFLDIQGSPVASKIKGRKPQCSASDLFHALGVPVTFAHNGGNDAVYELRAYLAELGLTQKQWAALTDRRSLGKMEETVLPPPPKEPRGRNDGHKRNKQQLAHGVLTQRAPEPVAIPIQGPIDFRATDTNDFPALGAAKSSDTVNKQSGGRGKNKKKFQRLDLS